VNTPFKRLSDENQQGVKNTTNQQAFLCEAVGRIFLLSRRLLRRIMIQHLIIKKLALFKLGLFLLGMETLPFLMLKKLLFFLHTCACCACLHSEWPNCMTKSYFTNLCTSKPCKDGFM
jgi:hypothetical protein